MKVEGEKPPPSPYRNNRGRPKPCTKVVNVLWLTLGSLNPPVLAISSTARVVVVL